MFLRTATAVVFALVASTASAQVMKPKDGTVKMCPIITGWKVCDKDEAPPAKAEVVAKKAEDEVCIQACMSVRAWELCETKSWFASEKGFPDAEPKNNRPTAHATARFFNRCGMDCRPKGTMRFGYESKRSKGGTGEWTLFLYGHPEDVKFKN